MSSRALRSLAVLSLLSACVESAPTLPEPGSARFQKEAIGNPDLRVRNAHIIGGPNHGTLKISFEEEGIDPTNPNKIQASARVRASYVCIGNPDTGPEPHIREVDQRFISDPEDFSANSKGSVKGHISLGGPDTFPCPEGSRPRLMEISYSEGKVMDLTHGVEASFEDVSRSYSH